MDPQQRLVLEVALGGARARRAGAGPARRQRDRRLPRHHHQRLRRSGEGGGCRTALDVYIGHRERAQRGGRARLLRAGPPGSVDGRRHRLLVVARGGAPGLPEPAHRRERARPGRWRERHPVARSVRVLLALGHDGAGRSLQDLRRRGRRLRARRGLRDRGPQAALRRAARRRRDPRRHPRLGGQPGRRAAAGSRCRTAWPSRR